MLKMLMLNGLTDARSGEDGCEKADGISVQHKAY